MTDEQVIARAVAAGWVWLDAPNRWGNTPGWQKSDHSFANCSKDPYSEYSKINRARKSFDHDRHCAECGVPKDACWDHVSEIHCFTCAFWLRLVREKDGERVVVGGTHYMASQWTDVCPEPAAFCGFGGRKFVVRFTDGPNAGRTMTTFNLWHQGDIPERFRDRLPDNAEFVEPAGWVTPRAG